MRRLFLTIFILPLAVVACTDPNAGRRFGDAQWAVRCDEMGGCTSSPERDVNNFDGEEGHSVSCEVISIETGFFVTFRVGLSGQYSLGLTGARVPTTGGFASGSDCRVNVVEGPNTLQGTCGAAEISEAQPCQVRNITFCDDMGASIMSGQVFCRGARGSTNPSLRREITGIGARPGGTCTTAAQCPNPGEQICVEGRCERVARFRIANCVGLEPGDLPSCSIGED